MPLHRVAMFLLKEEFTMHLKLFPPMAAHVRDEVVEPDPVQDAQPHEAPADGRGDEPGDLAARGGLEAGGGRHPGGDEREDVGESEEGGGDDADDGVGFGFQAPFARAGEAQEEEAEAKEGAECGVDGEAVEADEDTVG